MDLKRTKIVCTIGPSSWDELTLKRLIEEGMDVARLNLSHGTYSEKSEQISLIRKLSKELNRSVAVMADLQGPKLRLGEIDGEKEIKKGDEINLSLNPTQDEIPTQFDLSPYIKKGQRIFLNDGLIELRVTSVVQRVVKTVAANNGIISSHKGINIPDTKLPETFTEKDRKDAEFALKEGIDYLNLSFIQTADDLKEARELIKKLGKKTRIIVKIEKPEAVENIEAIVKASDAVMVARGDLAIETPSYEVPITQQRIIQIARQYNKPVVVATQMLESMTANPRPTRAETSDVANAVLSQVDAVMLSAESASGKYPVEAVKTMKDIILSVEKSSFKHYIRINWESVSEEDLTFSSITSSAASIAHRIGAKVIAVGTASGKSARLLSSFRPDSLIVAITHDEITSNQLSLVWGVYSIVIKPTKNFNSFVDGIIDKLKQCKLVESKDKAVIVSGTRIGLSGMTDTIKVATV